MAKIKATSATRSTAFTQLEVESILAREAKDCTVKAVALACNVSYDVAHKAMAKAGRKEGRGASRAEMLNAIRSLDYTATFVEQRSIIDRYPTAHRILKHVTTHHPERFNNVWADGNTYIAFTRGHVACFINGVNHDHTKGSAKRVQELFVITK